MRFKAISVMRSEKEEAVVASICVKWDDMRAWLLTNELRCVDRVASYFSPTPVQE